MRVLRKGSFERLCIKIGSLSSFFAAPFLLATKTVVAIPALQTTGA
jgi:hypothetical protein